MANLMHLAAKSVVELQAVAANVAEFLAHHALTRPDQPAVIMQRPSRSCRSRVTFAELHAMTDRLAGGLRAAGFDPGHRVLLMARPGVAFFALTFGMFRAGIVPVMIDPGMGVSRMLDCVRQVKLDGFVGIPLAHLVRTLRPGAFTTVRHVVTVGRRWFWGGTTLRRIETLGETPTPPSAPVPPGSHPAAILFTSGSTGPAKGVVYEHGMFAAQVRAIQASYDIMPGEIDVPTFPLFALFSVAMGMTAVVPDMDASHPGWANPVKIIQAIATYRATSTFGSPALWGRVAEYCVQRGITLPSLRRILVAGAPVPWRTLGKLRSILADHADVHTPYGATESLPVSSISAREVLGLGAACAGSNDRDWAPALRRPADPSQPAENGKAPAGCGTSELTRRGFGICVGGAVQGTDVSIIRVTDGPIETWSDDLLVPDGGVGEIIATGDVVTREYFGLPEATRASKIVEDDTIWHRTGDLGYLDKNDRLWFCGRKAHRVDTAAGTMFSVCCEAIFNEHPRVARCALVGLGPRGSQEPVIVVEPLDGRLPRGQSARRFHAELLELAQANPQTRPIRWFLFHRGLPVDIRHNAKINREALARWAVRRLAHAGPESEFAR